MTGVKPLASTQVRFVWRRTRYGRPAADCGAGRPRQGLRCAHGRGDPVMDGRRRPAQPDPRPIGSGKSTLLHLIAGLLRPSRGRVLVAGQDLAALTSSTPFAAGRSGSCCNACISFRR